jgi:hypothetical protein
LVLLTEKQFPFQWICSSLISTSIAFGMCNNAEETLFNWQCPRPWLERKILPGMPHKTPHPSCVQILQCYKISSLNS